MADIYPMSSQTQLYKDTQQFQIRMNNFARKVSDLHDAIYNNAPSRICAAHTQCLRNHVEDENYYINSFLFMRQFHDIDFFTNSEYYHMIRSDNPQEVIDSIAKCDKIINDNIGKVEDLLEREIVKHTVLTKYARRVSSRPL